MKALVFFLCFAGTVLAAESTLLWRDPGPIESLDLSAGPGGRQNAPTAPFTFVKEEKHGTAPKIVVTDGRGKKWMVKFGDEAKAETFASRIAWAAGYPVRASYYVASGQIANAPAGGRTQQFIDPGGAFRAARFQMFDGELVHEVPGGHLDLNNRREDQRELNGLKLALMLVSNWDVKPANSAVLDFGGRRYSVITDWGASMGDPAATDVPARKWNCAGYEKRTGTLIEGVDNGYVVFNYLQYAARHEHALSEGIRVEDLKWFMDRMRNLKPAQVRAALLASGANEQEADCFASAFQKRLDLFASAAEGKTPVVTRTQTVIKKTTQ